jgi:hypothetical protein
MTTVLFRFFVALWENHFGITNLFINLPLQLFNINFASSTTKTGRHDIAEILLKVVLKHQK